MSSPTMPMLLGMFVVEIQRFGPTHPRPHPQAATLHALRGNGETLLRWLETQLGTPTFIKRPLERVESYLWFARHAKLEICQRSLTTDAWTTARELLDRRDELCLAGWDGKSAPGLPAIVKDLAAIEAVIPQVALPNEAKRITAVEAALDAGQRLPEAQVVLHDPIDTWPLRWRQLLGRLPIVESGGATQTETAGLGAMGPPDVVSTEAASATLACRAIAGELRRRASTAESHLSLTDTVICCENSNLHVQLDEALVAVGLPSPGVSTRLGEQPALQVLPLILELCWEPVDPQLLLDFLTLPVSPLSSRATWRLREALTEQPGLGSRAWEEARARIEADDPVKAAEIDEWLDIERTPRSAAGLPFSRVIERAERVASWASNHGRTLLRAGEREVFREGLFLAAQQAELLADVATRESLDEHPDANTTITAAQLAHLLRAVRESMPQQPLRTAVSGAPTVVSSLAMIDGPYHRCVWLGTGTRDAPASRWTKLERDALNAHGIDIDDGTRALTSRRRAERSGLSQITGTLLTITLPHDEELTRHPLWQELSASDPVRTQAPVSIERALAMKSPPAPFHGNAQDTSLPFRVPFRRVQPATLTRPPDTWAIDPALLTEREYSSATELQTRLACPLQWVLNYQARLRPGSRARVPSSFLLKGRFCHAVLEEVLDGGGPLPDVGSAIANVERVFDERLPRDAAPLAQPAQAGERAQLRRQLVASTRVLIESLAAGGYRIQKMEAEFNGEFSGRTLRGFIDCLAIDANNNEAVIDFKYGGAAKYRQLLRDGRAVQLAIYAGARHAETGGSYPQVAYLIISDSAVHTPAGNPIAGASATSLVPGAPDLATVWQNFQLALSCADSWLDTGEVPVRPLQDCVQWPLGSNLVLTEAPQKRVEQDVCRYCEYRSLCGIEEVR